MMLPIGGVLFACSTIMAVSPIRRPRSLAMLSWIFSAVPIEAPFFFSYIVVASNAGIVTGSERSTPLGVIGISLALTALVALAIVAWRAFDARPSIERALRAALGAGWRNEIDPDLARRLRRHLPWFRILLLPLPFGRFDVVRKTDVSYGPRGKYNVADVYRHRSLPTGAPVFIHLHGGGFQVGGKSREGRPLLLWLASQGWTCISANYQLGRSAFPQALIDVKRLISWVREHGQEHGADGTTIFLAGSSAGAHLAAMVALTANNPMLQPGFEGHDTSITAGIGMYGYYGPVSRSGELPSTPLAYDARQAPPFLVLHGSIDTLTPVQGASELVARMRSTSTNPVVYAELPGAQHSFDMFHSIRFEAVVDGIEAFAAWVRTKSLVQTRRPEAR